MNEKSKKTSSSGKDSKANAERKSGTEMDNTAEHHGMQLSLPIGTEERTQAMPETKDKDFEEALVDLENIVAQLEGEVKLEEALSLFDRGMKLSQHCEEFLKSAEQKIEILKRAANGKLSPEKFDEESLQLS